MYITNFLRTFIMKLMVTIYSKAILHFHCSSKFSDIPDSSLVTDISDKTFQARAYGEHRGLEPMEA